MDKAGRYPKLADGEVTELLHEKEFLCFACCDCGMVHHWVFEPSGGTLRFTIEQQPRKTGQLRRRMYGNLHRVVRGWWMGRVNDVAKEG